MATEPVPSTIVGMETTVHEIAEGVYRLSTYLPDVTPAGFTMNQFLLDADEPLLFHCGLRGLFPLVSEAVSRVLPVQRLRWITFGHVEADECGAMNQWLAAAPSSQVAHGALGCAISIADMADRAPRPLAEGEVLDIGGHRLRQISTPHVPHAWEAQVLFDESTGTLLCGDLFTRVGGGAALVHDADMISPALEAEDMFRDTCLTPSTAPTMRALADLAPRTLALMHGPSSTGDCAGALRDLADAYADRVALAMAAQAV
jgi:flavorubredoxin